MPANWIKKLKGENLNIDWKLAVITIVSTILLMVDYYHRFLPNKYMERAVLYLVIPLLIIILIFRENPSRYGFQLGNWRLGLIYTLIGTVFMGIVLFWVARSDSMRTYYEYRYGAEMYLDNFLDLIGWEFIFRGFILFGYGRKMGANAIWIQAVPFALAHISKPEIETLSTIFGGFAFGWIAWRTKSFLYPFLIHYMILTITAVLASGILGF